MNIERVLKLIKISKNAYAEFNESTGDIDPKQMGDIIPYGYVRYIWFICFSASNRNETRVKLILAGSDPSVGGSDITFLRTNDNLLLDIRGGDIEQPFFIVRPDYSNNNNPLNRVYAVDYLGNGSTGIGGISIAYYDLKE